jgi:hypothetical protein
MTETIYFNGKKHIDISETPANVRQMVGKLINFSVDENTDGVPDNLQSGGLSGIKETINLIKEIGQFSSEHALNSGQFSLIRVSDTGIYINGKTYSSVAEMPDDIRDDYEKVVTQSQDGSEKIYDESWLNMDREKFFAPHDDENLNRRYPKTENSIETVDSAGRFFLIVAIVILIFAGFAAAWVLFF